MPSSGSRFALDTSGYAHFRRGHPGVVELIAKAEEVLLPVTVIGELLGGFAAGSRQKENVSTLEFFLAEDFVRVGDVTVEVAHRYGDLFAELRRRGTPVATNDLWIASTVMAAGMTLITFDSDFERIPGLRLAPLSATAAKS
jgi:predicted nucleic acid-binding protein